MHPCLNFKISNNFKLQNGFKLGLLQFFFQIKVFRSNNSNLFKIFGVERKRAGGNQASHTGRPSRLLPREKPAAQHGPANPRPVLLPRTVKATREQVSSRGSEAATSSPQLLPAPLQNPHGAANPSPSLSFLPFAAATPFSSSRQNSAPSLTVRTKQRRLSAL